MSAYLQASGVKGRIRPQAGHRGRGELGVQAGQVEMRHHGAQTLLLLVQLLEEVKRRRGGGRGQCESYWEQIGICEPRNGLSQHYKKTVWPSVGREYKILQQ